jgi:hypothetical protein
MMDEWANENADHLWYSYHCRLRARPSLLALLSHDYEWGLSNRQNLSVHFIACFCASSPHIPHMAIKIRVPYCMYLWFVNALLNKSLNWICMWILCGMRTVFRWTFEYLIKTAKGITENKKQLRASHFVFSCRPCHIFMPVTMSKAADIYFSAGLYRKRGSGRR